MGLISSVADAAGVGDYVDLAASAVDNMADGDWDEAFMDVAELGATAVADYYTGGQGGQFVGAAFDAGETLADGGDLGDVVDVAGQSTLSYYTQGVGN